MKRLIILLFSIVSTAPTLFGQDDTSEIFDYVEQMPQFDGNVNEFLSKNLRYPTDARDNDIQGRVIAKFIINELGYMDSIRIVASVYPSIDAEVIRLLRNMPKWKPGYRDGKPVKVNFSLPIKFSLQYGNTARGYRTIPYTPSPKQKLRGEIYTYTEQMPEPGFNIHEYFVAKTVYPSDALAAGVEGRVTLRFIVTDEGEIDSIRVVRSLYPSIDTLAIKIVDEMPLWEPGHHKRKLVHVYYTLPISFNLDIIPDTFDAAATPSFNLAEYFNTSMHHKDFPRNLRANGQVIVQFSIDTNGAVTDISLQRSVHPILDKEALRLVEFMPKWNPAKKKGIPIKETVAIPVSFDLQKLKRMNYKR